MTVSVQITARLTHFLGVFWTDRAVGALADLPLSLCDIVDLALVPVPGPLHHLQTGKQRVLLLLQLFHLFQLCEGLKSRGEKRREGACLKRRERRMTLRKAKIKAMKRELLILNFFLV